MQRHNENTDLVIIDYHPDQIMYMSDEDWAGINCGIAATTGEPMSAWESQREIQSEPEYARVSQR